MARKNNISTIDLPPKYPKPIGSSMMNRIQSSSSSSSTFLNIIELPMDMNTYLSHYEADHNHIYPSFGLMSGTINKLAADISMVPQGVVGDPNNNGIKDIILLSDDDGDDNHIIPSLLDFINNPRQIDYKLNRKIDPKVDPKKKKRILSNRISAQKYRMRKVEYVAQLEQRVNALQTEVALLISQVSKYDLKFCELVIENHNMSERMDELTSLKQSEEVQSVILTEERDWLNDLLREQQQVLLQTLPSMSFQDLLEWP
ncbi:basic leucine zipper 6-like [Macadamia integrifolia]|uniref:basic leucine zipper 6-like n=1 Tax=Macadamia integrifolia TaxID=60698 RepID=UPI001C527E2F|nr:basic leucine zipper 6-like [Macadamia integrifolia]